MAVFGKNAQEGLQFTISERGAAETAGKFNRLAGAADRVARSSGTGAAAGIGRLRQGLSGLRNVASNLIGTFARVGGILGLGGGFAIAGLLKEQIEVERSLSRIAFQGNRSAAQMARMRDTMNQVSGATGKTRAEVLAAIDASTDFGLSWEQAEAKIQQIVLWADLMGVSADEASAAVASMNRAMGGNANIDQMMSMLDAAARGSGFKSEGAFFQTVAKVLPQMEGVEGLGDINTFMQVIAGLGEELGMDPKLIGSGLKSLNRILDGDLRKKLEKVGVSGGNASEVLISMAQLLAGDANALDKAGLPDEVVMMARTMAGNLAPMRDMGAAVDIAAGKTEEFAARVADHAKDPEIAWAGTMERLKQAMEPLVTGVLDWFLANNETLIAAFSSLKEAVIQVTGGFIAAFNWTKENIGEPIAEVAGQVYTTTQDLVAGNLGTDVNRAIAREALPADAGFGSELRKAFTDIMSFFPGGLQEGTDVWRTLALRAQGAGATATAPQRVQVEITNRTDQDVTVRQDGRSAPAVAPAGG